MARTPFLFDGAYAARKGYADSAAYLSATGGTPRVSETFFNTTVNEWMFWDGSVWAPVGGGGISLAPGSNLHGTYTSSVTGQGDLTMTSDVVVDGDLIVVGNLVNDSGYALTVSGDLIISGNMNFTPSSTGLAQGNLTVEGDCFLGSSSSNVHEFKVNPTRNPVFSIGGDLTFPNAPASDPVFVGDGVAGTGAHGLTLKVFGSITEIDGTGGFGVFGVSMSGADNASGDGGSGGTLILGGSMSWLYLHMNGGTSTFATGNGGNAGTFQSAGGMDNCVLLMNGGDAGTGGTGGNGGNINVSSDAVLYNSNSFNGGASTDSTGAGGQGGTVQFFGNLVSDTGSIQARGGSGPGTGGNGGSITVNGNVTMPSSEGLDVLGGSGSGSNHGGNGGSITVSGNYVGGFIGIAGGVGFTSGTPGSAGISGSCNFLASTSIAGSFGSIVAGSNVTLISDAQTLGDMTILGDLMNQVGAALTVHADLTVDGAMNFTPSDPSASQLSVLVDGDMYLGNDSEFRVNAGQSPELRVRGDLRATTDAGFAFTLDGSGRDNVTANGLTVDIGGDCWCQLLTTGSNSNAGSGGNGGDIFIFGDCFTYINASGGSASGSGDGGNASNNVFIGGDYNGQNFNNNIDAFGGAAGPTGTNNGGSGCGNILINGNVIAGDSSDIINAYGSSGTNGGSGGNGGALRIIGNCIGSIMLAGADAGSGTAGSGGSCDITGSFIGDFIAVDGGSGGGSPGSISILGTCQIYGSTTFLGSAGQTVVTGDLTLIGDTNFNGDLVVQGAFSNQVGAGLNVFGDLITGLMNFTPSDLTFAQGNVNVYGDITLDAYENNEFKVNPGQSPTIYAYGNWTGGTGLTGFNGSGLNGGAGPKAGSGLNVLADGDIIDIFFILDGAPATATEDAGDGGQLNINSANNFSLSAVGGDSAVSGKNPGNGGQVLIFGDCYMYSGVWAWGGSGTVPGAGPGGTGGTALAGRLSTEHQYIYGPQEYNLSGGNSVDGNGGNGGSLRLAGEVNNVYLRMNGGNSTNASGGNAGFFNMPHLEDPFFTNGTKLEMYGGDGGTTGGDGGSVGTPTIMDIDAQFESVDLHGGAGGSGNGGGAGSITSSASIKVSSSINLNGGVGGAGNGADGSISMSDGSLSLPSGSSVSFSGTAREINVDSLELVGDTTINGDTQVNGKLSNPGGHALTVYGDLHCLLFDWTPADSSVSQADVTIHGDCYLERRLTNHLQAATITAENAFSDFNVDFDMSAAGVPNDGSAALVYTSGAHIGVTDTFTWTDNGNPPSNSDIMPSSHFYNWTVGWTLNVTWAAIENSVWPVTPTRQPTLTVKGDLYAQYGFSMAGMLADGVGPVNGGNIVVNGDVFAEAGLDVSAGQYFNDDPTGNGGNGGSITIGGDLFGVAGSVGADVWDALVNAGNGGTITIGGSLSFPGESGTINVSGGQAWNAGNGGNAGHIMVVGDVGHPNTEPYDNDNTYMRAIGGFVDNTTFKALHPGSGGTIHVAGRCRLAGVIADGGYISSSFDYSTGYPGSATTNGNGGSFKCDGDAYIGGISMVGGYVSGTASSVCGAGSGGTVTARSHLNSGVDLHGGAHDGSIEHFINIGAGNGGSITCEGDFLGSFNLNGGSIAIHVTYLKAGNGGGVTVKGNCYAYGSGNGGDLGGDYGFGGGNGLGGGANIYGNWLADPASDISFKGGDSGRGDGGGIFAGDGGAITVRGDVVCQNMSVDAGRGTGGTITIYGDANCTKISARGNDQSSDIIAFPGNGGVIAISGKFVSSDTGTVLEASGGSSIGGTFGLNGGNAGSITVGSVLASQGTVQANGGNAYAVGTHNQGSMGDITIKDGCDIGTMSLIDGTGATAPTASHALNLGGDCRIGSVATTNRSQFAIQRLAAASAVMLQMGAMTGKKVLKDASGDTGDISEMVGYTVFRYDPVAGVWQLLTSDDIGQVATTDATQTTALSIPTVSDTVMLLKVQVTARRTGGSSGSAGDSAIFDVEARVKNIAGTVTIPTLPQTNYEDQDQSWLVDLDVSGTSVRVRVTGAANNNVSWKAVAKKQRI